MRQTRIASYFIAPEQIHIWRKQRYTVPGQGTLTVLKRPDLHREQVFSAACVKLRKMVEEMYDE